MIVENWGKGDCMIDAWTAGSMGQVIKYLLQCFSLFLFPHLRIIADWLWSYTCVPRFFFFSLGDIYPALFQFQFPCPFFLPLPIPILMLFGFYLASCDRWVHGVFFPILFFTKGIGGDGGLLYIAIAMTIDGDVGGCR